MYVWLPFFVFHQNEKRYKYPIIYAQVLIYFIKITQILLSLWLLILNHALI
jgi:hypothetical protein